MNDQDYTLILLRLPDSRIVLQRRTKDAKYGAGRLGIFGGQVEDGESPMECIQRELKEETNLDLKQLDIVSLTDFWLPKSPDFNQDRHFFCINVR